MTTLLPDRRAAADARLRDLISERDAVLLELLPPSSGDDADRATNVDAHARLSMLDARIAELELELASGDSNEGGAIRVGDTVTLDFGDGPEQYLLATVAQAGPSINIVTPSSPLGKALLAAEPGDEVGYRSVRGREQRVRIVEVER